MTVFVGEFHMISQGSRFQNHKYSRSSHENAMGLLFNTIKDVLESHWSMSGCWIFDEKARWWACNGASNECHTVRQVGPQSHRRSRQGGHVFKLSQARLKGTSWDAFKISKKMGERDAKTSNVYELYSKAYWHHFMYVYIYIYYIYTYAQRPHQDLPFINTSDLNNIQPPSLNYIPLHCADHIYIYTYLCIYICVFPTTAYSYASPLLKLLVLVDSAISDSVGAPQGGLPNGAPVGGTAVFQVPYVFYGGVELEGHMKKPVPRLWQVVFVMIFCTHIHIIEIEET